MHAPVRPEIDSRSNPVYTVHNLQYIRRGYYNTIHVIHMCSIYNVMEQCETLHYCVRDGLRVRLNVRAASTAFKTGFIDYAGYV